MISKPKVLFIIFVFFNCNANALTNGVYYSRWIFKHGNIFENYPILSNKYDRDKHGIYLLSPEESFIADSIYISIFNENINVYYRHVYGDGSTITIGKGTMKLIDNHFVILKNKSETFFDSKLPTTKIYLDSIPQKRETSPLKKEIVPFIIDSADSFSVNCVQYLKVNGYDTYGLPDYSEGQISYNTNVFATDSGICGILLGDSLAPEIRTGKILFEKIN